MSCPQSGALDGDAGNIDMMVKCVVNLFSGGWLEDALGISRNGG